MDVDHGNRRWVKWLPHWAGNRLGWKIRVLSPMCFEIRPDATKRARISIGSLDRFVDSIVEIIPTEFSPDDMPSFLVLADLQSSVKLYNVEVDGWLVASRAYIGDQEAYQKVRNYQQPISSMLGLTEIMKESIGIMNAFGRAFASRSLGSVGLVDMLPVRVCRAWPSNQMEYLQHGEATSSIAGRRWRV